MGVLDTEAGEITAKIVYFGPEGSGTTTNLELIHRKLKREHRGDLKRTSIDGKSGYEFLPVQLGAVRGFATTIHIYTVPGGSAHFHKRRQILEGVDGIVFVADLRPDRHEATLEAVEELRTHFSEMGRDFDDVLFAVQYNHRDEADENALDTLHRQIEVRPTAHFEAVATEGTGVLQTLTTLSKQILANLRKAADEPEAAASLASDRVAVEPVMREATADGDPSEKGFTIASAGPADGSGGEVSVPIRILDEATGRTIELCLRLSLDTA